MYSTRIINKNWVDGNRYITVGDPYKDPNHNPFRQGKKGEKLTPFRTTQFPKNEENGYFTKVAYKAGGYQEATRYLQTQPLENRKKGFGTRDAHKTDEFSNAIRTEQHRATIQKEKEIMNKGADVLKKKLDDVLKKRQEDAATLNLTSTGKDFGEKIAQFDIGRERLTEFNPKAIKDTYYKFDNETGKKCGIFKPVSTDVGDGAWNFAYKPPSFGGKSEVKNFYDKSHLAVGLYT